MSHRTSPSPTTLRDRHSHSLGSAPLPRTHTPQPDPPALRGGVIVDRYGWYKSPLGCGRGSKEFTVPWKHTLNTCQQHTPCRGMNTRGPASPVSSAMQVDFFFFFLPLSLWGRPICIYVYTCTYFADGASGKEPACQCRRHERHGLDPWVEKMPWRRKWQPIPVFLPGESLGQKSHRLRSIGLQKVRQD